MIGVVRVVMACVALVLVLARKRLHSPYVFTSERGGPMTPKRFHTMISPLGHRAPAYASPHLRIRAGECRTRYAGLQAWLGHRNIHQLAPTR
jgi:hypothetical protein